MQYPLQELRVSLRAALVERDEEIDALLLGLVAREHVLLVGPPGTAKSHLCRSVAHGITGARYCERLLSPTTPPEAVWGPVSLAALREDRYVHATAGYAAEAEVLYLDEVGRASPAILDSLLHLLGPERQALIGTEQVHTPLVSAVGSANTWPEDAAMLDRWLLRRVVRPVSPSGRDALLWTGFPAVDPAVTLDELAAAHAAAMALPVTDGARVALSEILDTLAGAGIRPSDRRCRAAVRVARAAAVLDDAATVERRHLEPLTMVLWSQPDQADQAGEIITRLANPQGARIIELLRETDEAVQGAGTDPAARIAAIQKLGEILAETEKVAVQAGANGRAAKAVQHIRREHVRLQAAALGLDPAKAEALLGGGK
jgi:MoxR-like ATPase